MGLLAVQYLLVGGLLAVQCLLVGVAAMGVATSCAVSASGWGC